MEPKFAPNFGRERTPTRYQQEVESSPLLPGPERSAEHRPEYEQQPREALTAEPQPILPAPVVPVPVSTDDDVNAPPAKTDDLPLIANDDDLIEKEWVDKAKTIIQQTKDDPFKREQEIGRLQVDYLRKRYGRELGTA